MISRSLGHRSGILIAIGVLCAELLAFRAAGARSDLPSAPTDDTLRGLIAISDVVAVGTLDHDIIGASELGVISFNFGVEIEDVLLGDEALIGQTLRASTGKYIWSGRDSIFPPNLVPETRVVLFMNLPRRSDEPNVRYPWSLVSAEEGLLEADDALLERLRAIVGRSVDEERPETPGHAHSGQRGGSTQHVAAVDPQDLASRGLPPMRPTISRYFPSELGKPIG